MKRTQIMQEKQRPARREGVSDLAVEVSVTLAERRFSLEQILELHPGSILEFDRGPDEPLELRVGGSRVGQGRAVDTGEKLAFLVDSVTASPVRPRGGLES